MRKYFCDVCNGEMSEKEASGRLTRTLERLRVEVMVTLDGVTNGGDVCLLCILEAVNDGEFIKE